MNTCRSDSQSTLLAFLRVELKSSITTKKPLAAAPVWLLLTGSQADWNRKDCTRA